VSKKLEFVMLASVEGANVSELCRRFGVSRGCGWRWLQRYQASGEAGLVERSRQPLHSPTRCVEEIEAAVLAVRRAHPAWGGRKIRAVLLRQGQAAPAASTITAILRRNAFELGRFGGGSITYQRFEHERPNDLWQMDFKGHVAMIDKRLHPLTVLDDHSRYAIVLAACDNERGNTVKAHLEQAFLRYGMPRRMAVDNGPPWGDSGGGQLTPLVVWLIERNIAVSHSTPRHPQTLGKEERFHRSLKAEALSGPPFTDLVAAQAALDRWREVYNMKRPHEGISLAVPADRYVISQRPYDPVISPFEYSHDDMLRRVAMHGRTSFKGRTLRISRSLIGKTVAFRPTNTEGTYDVFFRHQKIKTIAINALDKTKKHVHDVPEHLSTMSPV
jgi:transposase InsO family protein